MTDTKLPPGLQAEIISKLAHLNAKPSPMEGCIEIKWRGYTYHLNQKQMFTKDSVDVTAVWIRSDGSVIDLLVEIDGEYRLIIQENARRTFTSVIRSAVFKRRPIERATA